jgi:arylsulfatase A-like enzyme
MHSTSLYDEQIRVPLVMRLPEGSSFAGETVGRRREPAQLADLPVTVLRLLGLSADGAGLGRSLLDPMRTGSEPVRSFLPDGTQAVIQGRFKLITSQGGNPALLFDLETDPGEHENLAGAQPDRVAHLRSLAWQGFSEPTAPNVSDFDDEARMQLEVLGYIEELR